MSKKTFASLINLSLLPLQPLEVYFLNRIIDGPPPICILGSARSGTTLVHQCLVARFRLGYLPRFVSFFPRKCLLASSIWKLLNPSTITINFESHYGKGKGLAGIHQGHTIWRRWFKWNRPNTFLSEKDRKTLKRTVYCLR